MCFRCLGFRYVCRVLSSGEFFAVKRVFVSNAVKSSSLFSSWGALASYSMFLVGVVLNAPRVILKPVFIVDFRQRSVAFGLCP